MTDIKGWIARRSQQGRQLYERYGKLLEKEHKGEYIAIGSQGQTILGESDVEVLQNAMQTFGSGNFAFHRVGYRTFGQWLDLAR